MEGAKTRHYRSLVKPVYMINGAEYASDDVVEHVRIGDGYALRILALSDHVVCGRDADRWICIDTERHRVFSSDSVVGVVYAFHGGRIRRIVEDRYKIYVKTDSGVAEYTNVYIRGGT